MGGIFPTTSPLGSRWRQETFSRSFILVAFKHSLWESSQRLCHSQACHRGGEYTRSIATGRMHNIDNTGSMVTVIQAHKGGRLHKSSANGGDNGGRVVVTSTGTNEQAEHDLLPRSKVARSSSDDRVVAAKKSAELDKTMETEQLSSLSSSSSSSSSISSKKSSQTNDMPSPGLSPIQRKGSKDGATTNNQSTKRPSAPVPQGLVALPVVTRSTRRQTFASAKAPSSKKERKAKSIIGETSPQSTTSSSSDDNMMDLFAPPQPVLTRSRQSSSAKSTKGNKKAAQDPPSSSPSTTSSKRRKSKASPKTPRDPKTGADAAERKAMSTTNKKQLASSGTLVHIPHPSQGDNFDPFATFHKSPTWAMDAMQTSIESAPARMPVSTQ